MASAFENRAQNFQGLSDEKAARGGHAYLQAEEEEAKENQDPFHFFAVEFFPYYGVCSFSERARHSLLYTRSVCVYNYIADIDTLFPLL